MTLLSVALKTVFLSLTLGETVVTIRNVQILYIVSVIWTRASGCRPRAYIPRRYSISTTVNPFSDAYFELAIVAALLTGPGASNDHNFPSTRVVLPNLTDTSHVYVYGYNMRVISV